MIPAIKPSCSGESRLASLLADMSEIKLSATSHNLAERLGHMFGLSGSVDLAKVLQQQPQSANQKTGQSFENLQQTVLQERQILMNKIIACFTGDNNDAQTQVPSAKTGFREEALLTYEPYRRFYISQQLEIASAVQRVRAQVREVISSESAELHQLAELDKTFEQNLSAARTITRRM